MWSDQCDCWKSNWAQDVNVLLSFPPLNYFIAFHLWINRTLHLFSWFPTVEPMKALLFSSNLMRNRTSRGSSVLVFSYSDTAWATNLPKEIRGSSCCITERHTHSPGSTSCSWVCIQDPTPLPEGAWQDSYWQGFHCCCFQGNFPCSNLSLSLWGTAIKTHVFISADSRGWREHENRHATF